MGKDQDSTLVTAEPIKKYKKGAQFPAIMAFAGWDMSILFRKKGLKLYFCRYFFPGLITKGYLIAETQTIIMKLMKDPFLHRHGVVDFEKLVEASIIQPSEPLLQAYMAFLFFSLELRTGPWHSPHGFDPRIEGTATISRYENLNENPLGYMVIPSPQKKKSGKISF
jgi:hypothetical protein